ncbi:MULE domain-containing protein, partial [Aphis craccivora]
MDGTFKSCMKYFLQLFTIHGFRNGLYVPLVFLVPPKKTLETYTKAFQYILAIHTSVKCVWLNAIIRDCRFNLTQSWWRTIQQLGLTKAYKSSNNDVSDLNQDALFPSNISAEFAATTNHTSNSCESYHAKLNASISVAHPSLFFLIEILLGTQSEIYVSLQSSQSHSQTKNCRKRQFLREKMLSFTCGELNRLNVVKE